MELKKCERCGCFFASNDTICPKCTPKELFELSKLKEYLEDHSDLGSIDTICVETGINYKNVNRYLTSEDFSAYTNKLDNNSIGNISINL